jgi:hypothetical protein
LWFFRAVDSQRLGQPDDERCAISDRWLVWIAGAWGRLASMV